MSEVVFKEGVLLSELVEADVPWGGDVPDVGRVLPPEQEVVSCFHRLFFGAEDDPDREKVPVWRQVDDLGGLMPLWAGEAEGKVFLHAGREAPMAGLPDDVNLRCSPVMAVGADGSAQVWRAGVPQLPYHVVPMVSRERVLRNADGEWRRLDWEPLGVFDVFPEEVDFAVVGVSAAIRYTLWCVIVGCFVVLFTTRAPLADGVMQDGAAARWPFSVWGRRCRGGVAAENMVYAGDGVFSADVVMPAGWVRLAPLPWQVDGGGILEAEGADDAVGGLAEGQFYGLPPVSVLPRYLAPYGENHSSRALEEAYLAAGVAEGYFDGRFGRLTKEVAREATVDVVQSWASVHYCVDPVLHEMLGRGWPDGAEEGLFSWSRPNVFRVVFSLHLDGGDVTHWPHWLGVMVAVAPSGLLMSASVGRVYNNWNG